MASVEEKETLLRVVAVPRTIEDHKLLNKVWIHASRLIITNTDSEEERGKSALVRVHWVTDIGYNSSDLLFNFELETVTPFPISFECLSSCTLL